jgi:formylglycine-generating enzyme required for sulfatase activity
MHYSVNRWADVNRWRLLLIACVLLALPAGAADAPLSTAPKQWVNSKDGMEFVWVPSVREGTNGVAPGGPTLATKSTNGFWLGRTEVTVAQFRRFTTETGYVTDAEQVTNRWTWKKPGFPQADNHPVVWLSWNDALCYARWAGVELPTESEWLHACRAGTTSLFFRGDTVEDDFVWHRGNASDGTRPVASRRPNAWGLHDLLGNAYEWCWLEERYGGGEGATGYPRGGSWTRCPDRFSYDLPVVGGPRYAVIAYDDDRGFRCLRRGQVAADLTSTPQIPAVLPGKGLAQHDFFYAGEAKDERMFIVKQGRINWSYIHPGRGEISDALLLPNGHILFAHQYAITEITTEKQIVWNYEAPTNTEIHTAGLVGPDQVWFIQNGHPARFRVISKTTGKIEREFELPVKNAQSIHGQFRQARMTQADTLLVAHMDLGQVVEYNLDGQPLWSVAVPGVWSAKPLRNGNILATSNKNFVREINRQGKTIWEWTSADAPDYNITNMQTAMRLANGNTLINNWFNQWSSKLDPTQPPVQAIEVTPDKQIVWALRAWTPPADLGPSTTIQLLDEPNYF